MSGSAFAHSCTDFSRYEAFVCSGLPSRMNLRCKHPTNAMDWEREEARWLREEQRWIREEQRWIREEQRWIREEERWNAQRKTWALESAALQQQIQHLKSSSAPSPPSASSEEQTEIARDEQKAALKKTPSPLDGQLKKSPDSKVKKILSPLDGQLKKAPLDGQQEKAPSPLNGQSPSQQSKAPTSVKQDDEKEKKSLRIGREGDEVKLLQEALEKLGFYCGEEEIEFCHFDTGTERAVKTWQASIGVSEDGIVTSEAFRQLLNGVGNTVVEAGVAEESKTVVLKESYQEIRVYLLGENRWENPDRLKSSSSPSKCLACRGERRTVCTECEGTGALNVEEQFLEWAEEGDKCPYCSGAGSLDCEECNS